MFDGCRVLIVGVYVDFFFFSSRRRHTRYWRDWSSDVCSSDLAWAALAGLCRQLAADLGPHGIRSVWLLSPGSPDHGGQADEAPADLLLGRRPTYHEVANIAVFASSDWAST